MPYIKPEDRKKLDADIQILSTNVNTVGDLNYVFSRLAAIFLLQKGLNYENINAVAGVFDAAGKEFYRRVAVSYEQIKIYENGDVPEYSEIAGRNAFAKNKIVASRLAETMAKDFYDKAST